MRIEQHWPFLVTADSRLPRPPRVTYDYDTNQFSSTNGLLLSITVGSGYSTYLSNRVINIGHDSAGRVTSVGSYLSSVTYDGIGRVAVTTLGNGVIEGFGYDTTRMQLTSQTATKSGGPMNGLMNLTYGYDAAAGQMGTGSTAGNACQLMSISGTINQTTESAAYTYDDLGRVVTSNQASNGSSAQRRFAYDRWGNRTGMWDAVSGGTQIQSIALQQSGGVTTNQIQSVTSGSTVNYIYDAAGNVTNDGVHGYTYDAENRIVSVDGGSTATYAYDQSNERYKKTVGSSVTHYVWQGSRVIAEHNGSTGASTADYVYSGSRMIAKAAGLTTQYFLSDRLSERVVLSASGSVLGRMAHLPFGEDFGESGTQEKHHFTSYERDGESGLDYAVNRNSSPNVGRFQQADPYKASGYLMDPQSWNRYLYTRNDPINYTDFAGLDLQNIGNYSMDVSAGSYSISAGNPFFGYLWGLLNGGGPGSTPMNPEPDGSDSKNKHDEFQDKAVKGAAKKLDQKDCGDFISLLLLTTSNDPAVNPDGIGVLTPIFSLLPPATYALILYQIARTEGRVSDSNQSGIQTTVQGQSTTFGNTHGYRTITWNTEFYSLSQGDAALQLIHESMHLIRNFSDQILANAAARMAGSATRFLQDDEATQTAASQYLNAQIRSHCQ